jgi:hypothetical protein
MKRSKRCVKEYLKSWVSWLIFLLIQLIIKMCKGIFKIMGKLVIFLFIQLIIRCNMFGLSLFSFDFINLNIYI